jgi:hypothetical protein
LQEGNRTLIVAHPDGAGLRVARDWTDADGVATDAQLAAMSLQNELTALRDLIELVDSLTGAALHS